MQITVEDGKPHVPALDGFAAATPVPYDPPLVHEMRYATRDLGQEGELGNGLVFTGVMSGASFESLAFESHPNAAGLVRGKPALLSTVPGGNGTLAWESAPGGVAYIGYSGSAIHPGAVEALRALANRARFLLPAQWQNKDRISVRGKSR
jgi:hypothetical protein